jgi:O-antigen/teichoic acid export membrane protein
MSLKRNTLWMLMSRVLNIGAAFACGSMINRALGPAGRGVYAEMLTWAALVIVVFGMSMDTGIYHLADRSRYPFGDRAKALMIALLSVGMASIAGASFMLVVKCWPDKFSSGTTAFIASLVLLVVFQMVATNLTVFIQATGNIKLSAFVGMIQGFAQVFIIAYGFLGSVISIGYAMASLIAVQAIALTILLPFVCRMDGSAPRGAWKDIIAIVVAGLKTHLGTICTFAMTRINQLIVFHYCGEGESGIYAVSLQLSFAMMFVPMAFQSALYPRVIHSVDEYDVTMRSLRMAFYGWGGVVSVCAIFAKPIVLAYGGQAYLASVTPFRILMLATWFMPLASLVAPYIIKKGAFELLSISGASMAMLSICLNLYLVPRYQSNGAAFSTALSCCMCYLISILFMSRLSGKRTNAFRFSVNDWKGLLGGRAVTTAEV